VEVIGECIFLAGGMAGEEKNKPHPKAQRQRQRQRWGRGINALHRQPRHCTKGIFGKDKDEMSACAGASERERPPFCFLSFFNGEAGGRV